MKVVKKGLMIIGGLCVLLFAVSACSAFLGGDESSETEKTSISTSVTDETTSGSETDSSTDAAADSQLWDTYYYVDDFNQETSEWYVGNTTELIGSFSNSATTDSALLVDIIADCYGEIGIFLYEYGNHLVKNSSNNYVEQYSITMQSEDGTNYDMTGTMYCGADRILIDESYRATALSLLQGSGNVKVRVTNMDRTVESYIFVIIPSNFAEEYAANTAV